jgi:hypothetical protein
MPARRLNVFDQDTLNALKKQSVDETVIARVRATMTENAELYAAAAEPKVVWIMGLQDARDLHEYLHRNRPGGHGAMHDDLQRSIRQAAAAS